LLPGSRETHGGADNEGGEHDSQRSSHDNCRVGEEHIIAASPVRPGVVTFCQLLPIKSEIKLYQYIYQKHSESSAKHVSMSKSRHKV